uniref:Protein containing plastocyanin/azurin family domain n=1 Tax=Rheinheimera sp. BAL341 TaxID=1708203 RepID=A0A486XK91_9GAMM
MHKIVAFFFASLAWSSAAGSLYITVTDAENKALPYTVVELVHPEYPALPLQEHAQVTQQDLLFQPFVSVVPQGSLVEFPNLDKTRHHVYSFSKAKTFELRLYAGKPEAPVLFDQAGIVTLGCNIHDYMLAYIYVAAGRFSAVTNENGVVEFNDLPDTTFSMNLWHPWQKATLASQQVSVLAGKQELNISLDITQQALPKAVKKGFGDY